MHLDGEDIGGGRGDHGFQLEFETTIGLHDLVFMWARGRKAYEPIDEHSQEGRSYPYRSDLEVVFRSPGRCILRLGFVNMFRVRRFEPKEAGYAPLPAGVLGVLLAFGLISLIWVVIAIVMAFGR